jgi:large conductance mechanosensitive channel
LGYGQFLTVLLNFLIIAAVLFFVIQAMNRLVRKEKVAEKPAEPAADVKLLTEIRDILAKKA